MTIWTADAVRSEVRPWQAEVWRVVEAQNRVSTLRLTDDLADQELLEALIEEVKPPLPPECAGLHYLLATPFRYAPYPHGSRFRRAGQRDGVFYASEAVETALAEVAFYRLLFFAESPDTVLPATAKEFTAFAVPVATSRALDLTVPPLDRDTAVWTDPVAYGPCQDLADAARAAEVAVLRYRSARDPRGGRNAALLTPTVFRGNAPTRVETWHIFLRRTAVQARREFPPAAIEFTVADFGCDPRVDPPPGFG